LRFRGACEQRARNLFKLSARNCTVRCRRGPVFENEGEAAGRADTREWRVVKKRRRYLREFAEFAVDVLLDLLELFRHGFAVVPWLQSDEEESRCS